MALKSDIAKAIAEMGAKLTAVVGNIGSVLQPFSAKMWQAAPSWKGTQRVVQQAQQYGGKTNSLLQNLAKLLAPITLPFGGKNGKGTTVDLGGVADKLTAVSGRLGGLLGTAALLQAGLRMGNRGPAGMFARTVAMGTGAAAPGGKLGAAAMLGAGLMMRNPSVAISGALGVTGHSKFTGGRLGTAAVVGSFLPGRVGRVSRKVGAALLIANAGKAAMHFGEWVGKGTDKLKNWTEKMQYSAFKFSEFSESMAQAAAESEVRKAKTNRESGENMADAERYRSERADRFNRMLRGPSEFFEKRWKYVEGWMAGAATWMGRQLGIGRHEEDIPDDQKPIAAPQWMYETAKRHYLETYGQSDLFDLPKED